MFFVSKLFTFIVISPFILIILGVLGFFWHKHPRRAAFLFIALIVFIALLGTSPVRNLLLGPLENKYSLSQQQLQQADAYVVLGGGIINKPQALSPYDKLPLSSLKRCLATAYWYKRYAHPIIVCGGAPLRNGESEARYLKEVLLELGIPEKQIQVEGLSRNTYENIFNAQTIMRRQHWQKAILVTSASHLPRSMQEAKKLKLQSSPLPCDFHIPQNEKVSFEEFLPNYKALQDSNTALKEYVGLIYYRIRY